MKLRRLSTRAGGFDAELEAIRSRVQKVRDAA